MRRLLNADMVRMYRGKWFWLCLGGMLAMAVVFVAMQYGAMDYTVPFSRVIFLPMSFYGVATGALVSLFAGTDFDDGFIRNKLIAGRKRSSVFFSNLLTSQTACVAIYLVTTLFTCFLSRELFEINVTLAELILHLSLGVFMCLAYGSIYCTIAMLCGSRTLSVLVCMGLAFFLLFLCLHTNQMMVQPQYKDGALNPHYVDGIRRNIYAWLHDINPSGQAAQLSAMEIFSPLRWILCDLSWMLMSGLGMALFRRQDIR